MRDYAAPPYRKLKGYAFDPSLSLRTETAGINRITYKVPWESVEPGPVGEYIEVIDYDPSVDKFYTPLDLNRVELLGQDGFDPSESNPQFHQQMVYAVAMTTIKNFEDALGRKIIWGSVLRANKDYFKTLYVGRLRIYPHAFRDANAYYSPEKKALLFGYFTATPANVGMHMPNELVFTCLSHDIIAHETTHAILDTIYPRYTESTNPDVLAFHEAFADIVALFQHFTFSEVLKNQIAKTRGDLSSQNLLGQLAQEFGTAVGSYGALRDALGYVDKKTGEWKQSVPRGDEYLTKTEAHERGSVLVSAVFSAYLTLYKIRVADLLRISSGGSGVLPQGELNPDLVNRLADEAAKTASHILRMCIRALDYCPPVDITFGDYLRAIITADKDLIIDDERSYRLAFLEAFKQYGIYPSGIKNFSVEALSYPVIGTPVDERSEIRNASRRSNNKETEVKYRLVELSDFLKAFTNEIIYLTNRRLIFETTRNYIYKGQHEREGGFHKKVALKYVDDKEFQGATGLLLSAGWKKLGLSKSIVYPTLPMFEIQSLHYTSRVGPKGNQVNQIIITVLQRVGISVSKSKNGSQKVKSFDITKGIKEGDFVMRGGATLIFDIDKLTLKYAISKPLVDVNTLGTDEVRVDETRALAIHNHLFGGDAVTKRYEAYFKPTGTHLSHEPFSFLHQHH